MATYDPKSPQRSRNIEFRNVVPLSGKRSFEATLNYRLYAYRSFEGNQKVLRDLNFNSDMLYGRINVSNIPVILRPPNGQRGFKFLKGPSDKSQSHMCIDFVADAFNDMLRSYKVAHIDGRIKVGEKYDALNPVVAHIDPVRLAQDASTEKYNLFFSSLTRRRAHDKIFNFKTFLTHFFEYLHSTCHITPVTLTGIIKSNFCPPNVSGLVIDLAAHSHMNDKKKVEEYIESPNFCVFASFAMNYGFYIDKNAPWRLIANLRSPKMIEYMQKAYIQDYTAAFNYFFEPAHYLGFEKFKDFVYNAYNSYVSRKPFISVAYTCGDGTKKRRTIQRSPINREIGDSIYDDSYWIQQYASIRNTEEQNILSDATESKLKIDAKNLIKLKEANDVLDMVESRIMNFEAKEGSFSNEIHKLKLRDAQKDDTIPIRGASSPSTAGSGMDGGY
jgi:hypothetical protein